MVVIIGAAGTYIGSVGVKETGNETYLVFPLSSEVRREVERRRCLGDELGAAELSINQAYKENPRGVSD